MRIGSFELGVGPVLVVAEAGVNHNGTLTDALHLVDAAASAGAGAVKFQVFRAAELAAKSAPAAPYQAAHAQASSQYSMLQKLELSPDEFKRIKQHCDDAGIMFLATPFSLVDVDRVMDLGVPAIKIASTDLTNWPLIEKALSTGLPLIISTGAATQQEIEKVAAELRSECQRGRIAFLHCVSAYPAPVQSINLRAMDELARISGAPVGFSDHTTSTQTGAWAAARGACLLEKHLTLDRNARGPDHFFSLDPGQMRDYIANVREVTAALGSGRLGFTEAEADVRQVARKSIVCAAAVRRGEVLTAAHLTLKRPGTGIQPHEMPRITGRKAKCDIPADALISWEMLD